MKVTRSIITSTSAEDTFALVSDASRYPEFFQGVTRWKPLTDDVGVGATYRVLMQVGSIEAGGTVRVNEWEDPVTIAWESEAGVRQRGRWSIAEVAEGTRLTLEVEYSLSGGPAGRLVEKMTSRIVGRHVWATLLRARRLLEVDDAPSKLHV